MWNKGREPVPKAVLKAQNPCVVPHNMARNFEVALLNLPEFYYQWFRSLPRESRER
jgi:hypothetical protein